MKRQLLKRVNGPHFGTGGSCRSDEVEDPMDCRWCNSSSDCVPMPPNPHQTPLGEFLRQQRLMTLEIQQDNMTVHSSLTSGSGTSSQDTSELRWRSTNETINSSPRSNPKSVTSPSMPKRLQSPMPNRQSSRTEMMKAPRLPQRASSPKTKERRSV